MSHFTVMVITDEKPDEAKLSAILMPYHEFECTGYDNEYVQDIKKDPEQYKEEFEKYGEGKTFVEFLEGWIGSKSVRGGSLTVK